MSDIPTEAPTEAEFRQSGYTANAINFPLTAAAFAEKCRWNGVDPAIAPRAWRYAPNEWCRRYWEDRVNP